MMVRRSILGGFVALALVGSPGLGQAAVSVNIGINLSAPPSFVTVPGSPVAYAPAVPANYFFYGGQYYVFTNGAWYVAPRYNGPWVAVAPIYVPRPILSVPVKYYRVPPPHWKQWRREAAPRWDPSWGREWKAEGDHEYREVRGPHPGPHEGHP
ncbi:MAG TPA: hypothetical protein VMS64_11890 [Candidatus Methylomirabilis sp.]|nr:hypothetical protein [Candidatus Methylomirabilis sp.]